MCLLLRLKQCPRTTVHFFKSNQINLRLFDGKRVPRLSQTQKWFTEYYSVDSVTATDMRNLNKVKKILNFEFSIYGSGDKVSIVISVKLLFTTVVD